MLNLVTFPFLSYAKLHHLLSDLFLISPSSLFLFPCSPLPHNTQSGLLKSVSQILSLPCLKLPKGGWKNAHPLLAAAGLVGLRPHRTRLVLPGLPPRLAPPQPRHLLSSSMTSRPLRHTLCLVQGLAQMSPFQRGFS